MLIFLLNAYVTKNIELTQSKRTKDKPIGTWKSSEKSNQPINEFTRENRIIISPTLEPIETTASG